MRRSVFLDLADDALLAQCAVDTYRASGPGGQKRNKTSSAVRLRHLPTGLLVIAEESRSQHQNKAKALGRLRVALALQLRESAPRTGDGTLFEALRDRVGRIVWRRSAPHFWPAAAELLDRLVDAQGQVRTVAEQLGTSTANIIELLQEDPRLWQEANRIREQCGQKPLRVGS
jgi:hypothetical protein